MIQKLTAKNSAEVLQAAKELLISVGWCQGSSGPSDSFTGKNTAYCVLSAIGAVHIDSLAKGSPMQEAFERMRAVIGTRYLFKWNDVEGRTKEEVLAAFDKAIGQEITT
jgi:hypothetical protein